MNNRSIFDIIKANDIPALKKILPEQDLTVRNANDQTPIVYAEAISKYECVATIAEMRSWRGKSFTTKGGVTHLDGMEYGHALLLSAKKKQPKAVKALLNAKTPDSWTSSEEPYEQYTSAHWAVENDDLETLKQLLADSGVKFDKKNKAGLTPVVLAAIKNRWPLVREIIKQRKDDSNGSLGFGSALLSFLNEHPDDIQLMQDMLNAGATLTWFFTDTGMGLLDVAVVKNKKDVVKLLLSRGMDPFKKATDTVVNNITPFERAINAEKFELIEIMVENHKVTQESLPLVQRASLLAASHGKESTIRALFTCQLSESMRKKNISTKAIDENDENILHKAVRSGSASLVTLILNNSNNLFLKNKSGMSAFEIAVSEGKWDIAEIFLKCDNFRLHYPRSDYGFPAIVKSNRIPLIFALLEIGVPINKQDPKTGSTALHLAVSTSDDRVFEYLLGISGKRYARGYFDNIDPAIKDYNNETAIVVAAKLHHWEYVRKLISQFGQSILFDDYKILLQKALEDGEYTIVECILKQSKLAVMGSDHRGNIALYLALVQGRVDLVSLLLDNDADPDVKNSQGQTSEQAAAASDWPNRGSCIQAIQEFKRGKRSKNQTLIEKKNAEIETQFSTLNENGVQIHVLDSHIKALVKNESDFLLNTLLPDLKERRQKLAAAVTFDQNDAKAPPQLGSGVVNEDLKEYSDLIGLINTSTTPHFRAHQILLLRPAVERVKLKEAKYLLNYLDHIFAVAFFKQRLKLIIDPFMRELKTDKWQVERWVVNKFKQVEEKFKPGTPKHIGLWRTQLNSIAARDNAEFDIFGLGNIVELYVAILHGLKSIGNFEKEGRHRDTVKFFSEQMGLFQEVVFNDKLTSLYSQSIQNYAAVDQLASPAYTYQQVPIDQQQLQYYSYPQMSAAPLPEGWRTISPVIQMTYPMNSQPTATFSEPTVADSMNAHPYLSLYSTPYTNNAPINAANNTVASEMAQGVIEPAYLDLWLKQYEPPIRQLMQVEDYSQPQTVSQNSATLFSVAPIATTSTTVSTQVHDYRVPAEFEKQEREKAAALERKKTSTIPGTVARISQMGMHSSPKPSRAETEAEATANTKSKTKTEKTETRTPCYG